MSIKNNLKTLLANRLLLVVDLLLIVFGLLFAVFAATKPSPPSLATWWWDTEFYRHLSDIIATSLVATGATSLIVMYTRHDDIQIEAYAKQIARTLSSEESDLVKVLTVALKSHSTIRVLPKNLIYKESAKFLKEINPPEVRIVMSAKEPLSDSSTQNGGKVDGEWLTALNEWLGKDDTPRLHRAIAICHKHNKNDIAWTKEHLLNPFQGKGLVDQSLVYEEISVSVTMLGMSVSLLGFPLSDSNDERFFLAVAIESEAITRQLVKWFDARYWTAPRLAMTSGKICAAEVEKFLEDHKHIPNSSKALQ